MPDNYPRYPSLPTDWLVPPDDQPDYLAIPGVELDEGISLGEALSDVHVETGQGDEIAIIHYETGENITFAQLAKRTDELADALVWLGVTPGSRVGVRSPNCPEGLIAMIATWKIGAIVVPIPFIARPVELEHYFADTQPHVVIADGRVDDISMVADRARAGGVKHVLVIQGDDGPSGTVNLASVPSHPREPIHYSLDSVAVVWHTGGITGKPKGCYHTQRRFLLAGYSFGLAVGAAPGQRWAAAAPIGHALGMIYHTIFTLLHGSTVVLVSAFADPKAMLNAIAEHRVTTFTAIAASWAGMQRELEGGQAPEPTALTTGYAMWQSSSSSEVTDFWTQRGITLWNNFGSTAFATWVLVPRREQAVPQGALGSPAPGYEIAVVDPATGEHASVGAIGQLIVRGASGLTYWRLPERQRAEVRAGWVHVDDLVQDAGGEVYNYLGRTDFLISTAGNKVAPSEVENVLVRHPAVSEVVVVGLPDPVRQEMVAAFVVVAPGVAPSAALKVELQNLVKTALSPYKYPRILEFLDALPRDHVGKVQQKVVREQALARMASA